MKRRRRNRIEIEKEGIMVKGVKITFEEEEGNTRSRNIAICHNKKKRGGGNPVNLLLGDKNGRKSNTMS